jgi:hypothetical protein
MLRGILSLLTLPALMLHGEDPAFPLVPPSESKPLVIDASFHLNKIIEINDNAETFVVTGDLTLQWKDARQAFDPALARIPEKIYQGNFQFDELSPSWFPQIVLKNQSEGLEMNSVVLRVKPDGSCTMISNIRANARSDFSMRLYPFDAHHLALVFSLPGFTPGEVIFQAGDATMETNAGISQWLLNGIRCHSQAAKTPEFAVILDTERDSFFSIRLVAIPLFLIVILSWSVFWMEKSSVGDRVNLSFVGILTAVAYQVVIGDLLPDVSYVTLMHAFLNISFLMMCATVVINLIVAHVDKSGRAVLGDAIDRKCRLVFPVTYLVLIALAYGIAARYFV